MYFGFLEFLKYFIAFFLQNINFQDIHLFTIAVVSHSSTVRTQGFEFWGARKRTRLASATPA